MLREAAAMLMDIFLPAGKAANGDKNKRKQSTRHAK
jgi:hypothetical protein